MSRSSLPSRLLAVVVAVASTVYLGSVVVRALCSLIRTKDPLQGDARVVPKGTRSDVSWMDVSVDPQVLELILTLIAVGATAMVAAVTLGDIVQTHRSMVLSIYIAGLLGLGCAMVAFARLCGLYLRQLGLISTRPTLRFLVRPYGLVTLSLSLIGAATVVLLLALALAAFGYL
jgi:hypothetical protein